MLNTGSLFNSCYLFWVRANRAPNPFKLDVSAISSSMFVPTHERMAWMGYVSCDSLAV